MFSAKIEKILLLASIITMVAGYNLHPFLWKNSFYHFMAFGIFLAYLLIKSLATNRKDIINIVNICFSLSINNILDELFFNPTAFSINDYIVAVIIIIWQIHRKTNLGRSS